MSSTLALILLSLVFIQSHCMGDGMGCRTKRCGSFGGDPFGDVDHFFCCGGCGGNCGGGCSHSNSCNNCHSDHSSNSAANNGFFEEVFYKKCCEYSGQGHNSANSHNSHNSCCNGGNGGVCGCSGGGGGCDSCGGWGFGGWGKK